MRTVRILGIALLSIVVNLTPAYADDLIQSFDFVATPALPDGWSSTANNGSVWQTTSAERASLPNSAFGSGALTLTNSSLTSPVFSFPGAGGPITPKLSFFHRYNFELNITPGSAYDGGVLEISVNGGAFQDFVAADGNFISGDYTHTIVTAFNNPLAGRRAWGGDNGSFTQVEATLPPLTPGSSIQLRWRLGTDSSQASQGWYVDNVMVTVDIDLSVTLSSPASNVIEGNSITFNGAITNNSSADSKNAYVYLHTPSENSLGGVSISNGIVGSEGAGNSINFLGLPAGSSKNFSVIVNTVKPRKPSGKLILLEPVDVAGREVGAGLAQFSAPIPSGSIEADTIFASDAVGDFTDLCESSVLSMAGKIAIVTTTTGCPVFTKALNAQAAGAIAVVIYSGNSFPIYYDAPLTPTVTIPVFDVDGLNATPVFIASRMSLSGGVEIVAMAATVIGSNNDPDITNNARVEIAPLLADSDGDGVADTKERCPTDPNKVAPGVCGCGVDESDANGNGAPDCAKNADLKAYIARATAFLKQLSINKQKPGQASVVTELNNIVVALKAATTPGSGVTATSNKINLSKLGKSAGSAIKKALKRKDTFASDRSSAKTLLKQLLKGVGA